jgi:hypothetical protein
VTKIDDELVDIARFAMKPSGSLSSDSAVAGFLMDCAFMTFSTAIEAKKLREAVLTFLDMRSAID